MNQSLGKEPRTNLRIKQYLIRNYLQFLKQDMQHMQSEKFHQQRLSDELMMVIKQQSDHV